MYGCVWTQDHLNKEAVEAFFDAMGGLITDASFEVRFSCLCIVAFFLWSCSPTPTYKSAT